MSEMHRARYEGKGVELPCPLWAYDPPSTSTSSLTWKVLPYNINLFLFKLDITNLRDKFSSCSSVNFIFYTTFLAT